MRVSLDTLQNSPPPWRLDAGLVVGAVAGQVAFGKAWSNNSPVGAAFPRFVVGEFRADVVLEFLADLVGVAAAVSAGAWDLRNRLSGVTRTTLVPSA